MVGRELLTNRVPTVPGGGTVQFVNAVEHRYLTDPVHREEGGTPAIVESIRGIAVENLDIADLKAAISQTSQADVKAAFTNLLNGSQHHQRRGLRLHRRSGSAGRTRRLEAPRRLSL